MNRVTFGLSLLAPILLAVLSRDGMAAQIDWARQYGASANDASYSVSADGLGHAFIAGSTRNILDGTTISAFDGYVASFDLHGNREWTRQIGSSASEFATSVSADRLGSVYVGGWTRGNLAAPSLGFDDEFLNKFDSSGNLLWKRQFGTNRVDIALGVSADALGSVFIAGSTSGSLGGTNPSLERDAVVSKFDAAGNVLWHRQLGTVLEDVANAVAADGLGNVYIAGSTNGVIGGPPPSTGDTDAFLARYDAAGNLLWTRQIGTQSTLTHSSENGKGVAADSSGNAYITGTTSDDLFATNAGGLDAFLVKYDSAGNLLWARQVGTAESEDSTSVTTDGLGNIYISGNTSGAFSGTSAGGEDAFVIKFDALGNFLWSQQLGSDNDDESWGVSADGLGNVYFSGWTEGDFAATSAGGLDAFLVKISNVPEPPAALLAFFLLVPMLPIRQFALRAGACSSRAAIAAPTYGRG